MKKKVYTLLFILLATMPAIGIQAADCDYFFSCVLLAPTNNPERVQFAQLITNEFPKIGIQCNLLLVGWDVLIQRTLNKPTIASYVDGGFDMVLMGWVNSLDWLPNFYSSDTPVTGSNYYGYNNPDFDYAYERYVASLTVPEQNFWSRKMQSSLYNDTPATAIAIPQKVHMGNDTLTGFKGDLWFHSYDSIETWTIPGQSDFSYATAEQRSYTNFHIFTSVNHSDIQWLSQIYDGLFRRNINTHAWIPWIADTVETTDGLEYNIELKHNALWADGTPINASDIEFSFETIANPLMGSPKATFWQQYLDPGCTEIIDEFELNITFTQPYVFQHSNLALDIIPKHIWQSIPLGNFGAQAELWALTDPTRLIGSGPYYLYDYDNLNEIIHLKRNDYYNDWQTITPYFSDIYFHTYSLQDAASLQLLSGNIDMLELKDNADYPVLKNAPGITGFRANGTEYQELGFNVMNGAGGKFSGTQGYYIRKAISHMIPRQDIIDYLYAGHATKGGLPCSNVMPGLNRTIPITNYNFTKALEYMALAGFDVSCFTATEADAIHWSVIVGLFIFVGVIIKGKRKK